MSISARRMMRALQAVASSIEAAGADKGLAVPEHEMRALSNTELDALFATYVDLNIKWLRFDFYWGAMEQTQGTINYSDVDRIITRCVANDIRILPVIHTTPVWARPATVYNPSTGQNEATKDVYGPTSTSEQNNYASFVGRVAQHYKGVIHHYEIWNEQNLPQFWQPTPSVGAYCSLLSKAYDAIKAVDPDIYVLSGGTGGAVGPPGITPTDFIHGTYDNGANLKCDGIAVHPYSNKDGQMSGELWNSRINIRDYMDSHGDSTKLLWGTETGTSTSGPNSMTEAGQAKLATDSYAYWRGMHHAGPLFWFTYFDDAEVFGITRPDGSQKPAFATFKAVPK